MFGKKTNKSQGASSLLNDPHVHIPMEPLAEKEIFEALPDPVDFSTIKPTTRYQFRGMARRALSYHRRQRFTTIGCLVIWPILLVVLVYVLNMNSEDLKGLVRYCTNEADVQYGGEFDLSFGKFRKIENQVFNSAHYPIAFESYYPKQACVRWFGESYPVNQPYQNATWASTPSLDSFYIPSPDWGWFNKTILNDEYQKMLMNRPYNEDEERYPKLFQVRNVNQTVYYSTANADIARILGTTANVTRGFTSDSWPPTNTSITLYNSSRLLNPADGVLGAIPVRYSSRRDSIINGNNGNITTVTEQIYTAGPVYRAFESKDRLDEAIRTLVSKDAEPGYYYSRGEKVFGGLHFDTLDVEKAKVTMKMQLGVYSEFSESDPTPGLRQMIVMSQMTNALTRLKFKGQFVISQGIRALPYEFLRSRLNNRFAGSASGYLSPFALSFLLPSFVTILVQEKEDRHRMMMSMNGLKSGAYYLAHYAEFMTMQLILTFFFAIASAATKSDLFFNTNA
ncbi:hypothetical protein BGZ96_004376, partial [Linnemannia gamsii]